MSPRRRAGLTVGAAACMLLAAVGATPATAAVGRTVPTGAAGAQIAAAIPVLGGNLSLPIGFGQSAVDIEDKVARASSALVNYGILGALSAGFGIALPYPAKADTRDQHDVERSPLVPAFSAGLVTLHPGHESAHVTQDPSGRSRTTVASFAIESLVVVSGLVSQTEISAKEAAASVSIAELRLGLNVVGGDVAILRGIEWYARQEMGKPAAAAFSVASFSVLGQRMSGDAPAELAAGFDAVNQAIAPTGVKVLPPRVDAGQAGGAVEPLRVMFRDSPLLAATVGQAYKPLAPVVSPLLVEAQNAAGPGAAAFLVASAGINALLGTGGAGVDVGGAAARLGARPVIEFEDLNEDLSDVGPIGAEAAPEQGGFSRENLDFAAPAAGSVLDQLLPPPAGFEPSAPVQGDLTAAVPTTRSSADEERAPAPLVLGATLAGLALLWAGDRARARRIMLGVR